MLILLDQSVLQGVADQVGVPNRAGWRHRRSTWCRSAGWWCSYRPVLRKARRGLGMESQRNRCNTSSAPCRGWV